MTTSIFYSKFEPTMWPHRYFGTFIFKDIAPPPSKSNKTPYHTACVRSKVGPRYRKWRLKQTSQVMLIFSQLKLLITGQVVQIKLRPPKNIFCTKMKRKLEPSIYYGSQVWQWNNYNYRKQVKWRQIFEVYKFVGNLQVWNYWVKWRKWYFVSKYYSI